MNNNSSPNPTKYPAPHQVLYGLVPAGHAEAVANIVANLASGWSPEGLPADGPPAPLTADLGLMALEARMDRLARELADSPLKAHLEWQTDEDGDRKLVVKPRPPKPADSGETGKPKAKSAAPTWMTGERITWGPEHVQRYGKRAWAHATAMPRETEKAVMVVMVGGGGAGVWLPRSQVHVFQRADGMFLVCMRDWFAAKISYERQDGPAMGLELLPIF